MTSPMWPTRSTPATCSARIEHRWAAIACSSACARQVPANLLLGSAPARDETHLARHTVAVWAAPARAMAHPFLWESTALIRQVVTLILWERPRPRCFRSCGSALAMPGLQRHLHRLVLSPICRAQARSRREEGRLLLLWERACARWDLPAWNRLHTCLAATSSAITRCRPCCQSGRTIPKSCCSLRLSSTDQAGRRAGVG